MNKEKLVNFLKKNKISIIIGSIVVIGGYWFTHTNFSYHLEDRTGKYILNPEYKEFHKYEWTDLKTVYPTKLAYDPTWFKLPPEKYIPKEQPIPREISSISDPIIRRQAYFNFLCKTEEVHYLIENYNYSFSLNSEKLPTEEGILYLNQFLNIPKLKHISESNKNQKNHIINANNNPFLLPIYKDFYYPLIEGHIYNFYGVDLSLNPKSLNSPFYNSKTNQFSEFMDYKGQLFRIEFDLKTNQFLPAKKINSSNARYYNLTKFIERESLKNLGIYGIESIIYDKNNNKLVGYTKNFYKGAFLPWQEEYAISNFSWTKLDSCKQNKNIINNF